MRVIVTGAGGFVGRALVAQLRGACDVVATDLALGGIAGVEGDLAEPDVLARVFAKGCDAVIHLATVPGGVAEDDPGRAKRVNLDATMALVDAAARAGTRPRFVFASSIAVLGACLPQVVDDNTMPAPVMLYGAHKALMEEWIATMTRRGSISGLSLRLPGIVARPKGPSGLRSAFMSDLFSDLSAARAIELPVSPGATLWLMSASCLARNLEHALRTDAAGSVTLPALRVSLADLVAAVCLATGADPDFVRYVPDAQLEAAFGSLPRLATPRANELGFSHDGDLAALVRSALTSLRLSPT